MATQYYCKNERRRDLIRSQSSINGIDFIEVSEDQRILEVNFIHPLPDQAGGIPSDSSPLSLENIVIEGGVRVRDIRVTSVEPKKDNDGKATILEVKVNVPGDFSIYRLRLQKSPGSPDPPDNFDRQLSEIEFSFKVNCPTDFDCKSVRVCPSEIFPEPHIDYLAKDYASFKSLILDRLSIIMPDWKERSPADLGMVLTELLAYAGDYLSYYQDAVATEAYLTTARKRVSVRRHARLLDYPMHDGCNSRAWVCFKVNGDNPVTLARIKEKGDRHLALLTGLGSGTSDRKDRRSLMAAEDAEVFELLHDIILFPSNSRIEFYTWGDEECCLPRGATRATLCDTDARLRLAVGDVLIFEELQGASSEADPKHRHAVRLTHVDPEAKVDPLDGNNRIPGALKTDHLTGMKIVDIEWHSEDALPFSLCLSSVKGGELQEMSCAWGNVALVDQGCTYSDEELVPPRVPLDGCYLPHLGRRSITFKADYDHNEAKKRSTSSAIIQDPHEALPELYLIGEGDTWKARRDLLNSDRFAPEFVVETENDASCQIRFGDDVNGKRPTPGATLKAFYRVGSGSSGNVGADTISYVIDDDGISQAISARNPMPAMGGSDPEPTYQVSLYAPWAFRKQERAVTEEDYAEVAMRHPEVQRAVATLCWTGSWHTVYIAVDRKGGREVDNSFAGDLKDFLERYRLAGQDIEIEGPKFVPLEILIKVCVKSGYQRISIKQTLLEAFSNTNVAGGRRGFFHPDNFSFGQPVYLSRIIADAMRVPGVLWVQTERFQRWGAPSRGEIDEGLIRIERLEIARLDNDPSYPENGRIDFVMTGGI
jgi:hypothetical protein